MSDIALLKSLVEKFSKAEPDALALKYEEYSLLNKENLIQRLLDFDAKFMKLSTKNKDLKDNNVALA